MRSLFTLILVSIIVTVGYIVIKEHVTKQQTSSSSLSSNSVLENSSSLSSFSQDSQNADVSLEEKIGQMLIVGFRGTKVTASSSVVSDINKLHIGGVILFDSDVPSGGGVRNITSRTQLTSLISNLKKLTNPNLIVSIDLEGGLINRLKSKYGFQDFPSAEDLGKAGNIANTENVAKNIGSELASVGITMDFAPDTDVNVNPKNPIIGALGRSFSSDPNQVALEAKAFIDGLHKENILTVIKHFPGHGSSTSDSHLGFVDITKTYKQEELIPFEKLKDYTDAIMVAHVTNINIDKNYPASLSTLLIQNILRKQLGYKGVVISDDMNMGAISKNYTYQDAIIRAVNAGNDMIIISNNAGKIYEKNLPDETVNIILNAVKNGDISETIINDAYKRIQTMENKYAENKN